MLTVIDSKQLDGKTLEISYYCEPDICLLVGKDSENNVYIIREEINRKEADAS